MGACSSLMGQVHDPPCLVIDKLYLGSIASTLNATLLHSMGIRAIVNCSNMKAYHPTQFEFFDVNIPDTEDAPIEQFFGPAVQFIDDHIKNGNGVLVHCHAGISRSTTIVLAYLIHAHHSPLVHAFFFTKQHRHIASPNPGFMECLVRLEASLFGGVITIDPAYYRMERYGEIEDMFDARMIDDIGDDDDDVGMVPTLNQDSKKNFIQQRHVRIPITQFKTRRSGVPNGLDTDGSEERQPATLKTLKLLRNGKKCAAEQKERMAQIQAQVEAEKEIDAWAKQQELRMELTVGVPTPGSIPPFQPSDPLASITDGDHMDSTPHPVPGSTFDTNSTDLITAEFGTHSHSHTSVHAPSIESMEPLSHSRKRSVSRIKYEQPIIMQQCRPPSSSYHRRLSHADHELTAPMPGSISESPFPSIRDPRMIDVSVSSQSGTYT